MTKDTPQKPVSLGDAAYAAGIEWTRVRNWLDRGQIKLDADADKDSGKHRRFYFWDVVRIGMIGRFVRYGMNVETASKMTETYFMRFLDKTQRQFLSNPESPANLIRSFFDGSLLAAWYDSEKDTWSIRQTYWGMIADGALTKISAESDQAFTLIDLGEIANTAFERLQEED